MIFGDEEQMKKLKEFLTYSGFITADLAKDEKEGVYELYVGEAERQKAAAAVRNKTLSVAAFFSSDLEDLIAAVPIRKNKGKVKEKFYREAFAEYEKRLGKYCRMEVID